MDQRAQSYRAVIFYSLLPIDVIIVVITFNTALLMPLGLANFVAGLIFGCISLIIGIWATVQYIRGKHDFPILMGLSLGLVGLIMVAGFFIILSQLWSGSV